MAFQPLSVGDILMLSQHAWKIGRAFTQGRNSAPAEFAEVEREANGLSDALKLTAETLHADGSILSRAEPETRGAVNAILDSAGRTLGDLESFIERYQVIRKRETTSGFVVERSWSEVVMANYKTFKWTTEGGDITDLRNMLQMHTNTINLTMQALQSRSLARLEKTVIPMAENISLIHQRVNGDLGNKIDDLHRIIMSIASSTPSLVARDRAIEGDNQNFRPVSTSTFSTLEHADGISAPRMLEGPPPRSTSFVPRGKPEGTPRDSVQSTPVVVPDRYRKDEWRKQSNMDWEFETGSPPKLRGSIGGSLDDSPTSPNGKSHLTPSTPASYRRESSLPRRESSTLPSLFHTISEDDTVAGSSRYTAPKSYRHKSYEGNVSPISEARSNSWRSSKGQPVLPPPAIPPSSRDPQTPATPSSFFGSVHRSRSDNNTYTNRYSRPKTAKSEKGDSPVSPALSSLAAFEKALFRNAAILCDVRCRLIEYAQQVPDEPDPRYATEMVEACTEARVCVIRKREYREQGTTRVVTSIWALKDDGQVRCQQKLSDYSETVPYCSYFQPEKVSIAESEMSLIFHGKKWGDMLEKEIQSDWVNYVFASEDDAVAFQSAVFGRMLIGTFRTTKTIVIHEGIKGAFAFEEQFANIETLRLWEDDGVSTPGAQGGVLALMHISSNFGDGWARWWMNSSKQQVRVKGEGFKLARLKGIDITVVKPGSAASTADRFRSPSTAGEGLQRVDTKDTASSKVPMKKIPVKRVTGVKIEFKIEEERTKFVDMSHKVQERMLLLPDL